MKRFTLLLLSVRLSVCQSVFFLSVCLSVVVCFVQVRESAAESDKTQQGVMQNRQYQIDAAIVRIMKGESERQSAAVATR